MSEMKRFAEEIERMLSLRAITKVEGSDNG